MIREALVFHYMDDLDSSLPRPAPRLPVNPAMKCGRSIPAPYNANFLKNSTRFSNLPQPLPPRRTETTALCNQIFSTSEIYPGSDPDLVQLPMFVQT